MVNAQKYLNKNYKNYPKINVKLKARLWETEHRATYSYFCGYTTPMGTVSETFFRPKFSFRVKRVKNERKEKTYLDIHQQNLTGTLNLNGFTNLKALECSNNQLTNLILPVNNQIKRFNCHSNKLTSLPINLNPETLTELNISNNNFSIQDLTIFSQLVNLETLSISNNQFTGSLAPLASLSKLKKLCIANTQIDSGLEYLPKSLEKIYCGETKLAQELQDYKVSNNEYDYQAWRKAHPELTERVQKVRELEVILVNLNSALDFSRPSQKGEGKTFFSKLREWEKFLVPSNSKSKNKKTENKINETVEKGLQIFIFETQSEIIELRKQNQEYYESKIEIPPKSN